MPPHASLNTHKPNGFALATLLVYIGIAAAVAAIVIPVALQAFDKKNISEEKLKLEAFAEVMKSSFTESSNRNMTMDGTGVRAPQSATVNSNATTGAITANTFDGIWTPGLAAGEEGVPSQTGLSPNSWESKLTTLLLGDTLSPGRVLSMQSDETGTLLFNSYGNKRLLIRGPTNEASAQRWILMSVLIKNHRGMRDLPLMDFNSLWQAAQTYDRVWPLDPTKPDLCALWNSSEYAKTNASRAIIQCISQKKYNLCITNTSDDSYIHAAIEDGDGSFWVSGNTDGGSNYVLSPYGAVGTREEIGNSTISGRQGILLAEGTEVIINTGRLKASLRTVNTTWTPPGAAGDIEIGPTEMLRFRIKKNTEVILNPTGQVSKQ